jgi:hypothetical protein
MAPSRTEIPWSAPPAHHPRADFAIIQTRFRHLEDARERAKVSPTHVWQDLARWPRKRPHGAAAGTRMGPSPVRIVSCRAGFL